MKKKLLRYWKAFTLLFVALGVWYYLMLPRELFRDPYSTVLVASNGELLSATIAGDGQWRFPQVDSVPPKLAEALITFEDKRFRHHPGVDVVSLGRAFRQNLRAGKTVSGGSTISMQVIRLSRKNTSRSVIEKFVELVLATRLELRYSKNEILALYFAHAPYGGNVVGVEAACWRYFGTGPFNLSWAEAALLAVLPNSPSLMHPGKNRDQLRAKRDRVLDKLFHTGKIDEETCALAKAEDLPQAPLPLPQHARHLLTTVTKKKNSPERILSSLDQSFQVRAEQIVADHHERLASNQIFNAAAVVLEVSTGATLAYVGNVALNKSGHGEAVDVVQSPRSTGSILKPFLYAAMLDEGKILPGTLLPDIPVMINGFAPKNFSRQYDGAVPADHALIRSLNIPAVHLLRDYRYEKFHRLLQNMGVRSVNKPADHYGLSLILGGAESSLWEVCGVYASMARTLNNYFEHPGKNRYDRKDFHAPRFEKIASPDSVSLEENSWLSASSIYLTFEALKELNRPSEESGWRSFSSTRKIAWKTGTSFGFRDGWAIGVTPDYVVGVWVGNAAGDGRPGLTGIDAAAPLMFDLFSMLPGSRWFQKPMPEMQQVAVCKQSGCRVSSACTEADTVWVSKPGLGSRACPYHKIIHLSPDLRYQVHGNCAPVSTIRNVAWFVLPPVQEYYYRSRNSSYHPMPAFRKDCQPETSLVPMDMIYPKEDAKLFIPRNLDGKPGSSLFELAHRDPSRAVHWHLDGIYVGTTTQVHHLALSPPAGKHTLTMVDDSGEFLEREFEVIANGK